MKFHIKAFLLSAFVLPGLGQLYKGERLKGVILILLVNVFLLATLFMVLKNLGPAIVTAQLSGSLDTTKLLEQLSSKAHAGRLLLSSFFVLWLYGSLDAAMHHPRQDQSQIKPKATL